MLDANHNSPSETNPKGSPESTPTNSPQSNKLALQKILSPIKRDSQISNVNSQENISQQEQGSSQQTLLIKLTAINAFQNPASSPDILSKPKVQAFETRIVGNGNPEERRKALEYCKEYPMHADLVKSILISKNRTDDDVMTLYEKLRELPFFAKLEKEFTILTDNEAFLFLLRHLSWVEYPKGKFIGKEHEPFDSRVFVINKGRVCILATSNSKYEAQQLREIDPSKAEECLDDSFNEIDDPEIREEGAREKDRKENFLSPRIIEELEENKGKGSKPNSKENSIDGSKKKFTREGSRHNTRLLSRDSTSPKKFTKDMIVDAFVKRKTTTVYNVRKLLQNENDDSSAASSPLKRMQSREVSESPAKRRLAGVNPQNNHPKEGDESPEKDRRATQGSESFSFSGANSPLKIGIGGAKSGSLWKKLQANLMKTDESPVSLPGDQRNFTYPESPQSKFKYTLRKYVFQKYGHIVDHLSDGQSFCEKALFSKQRKAFSVVAMTNLELITLSDDKFVEARKKLERKKKEAIDFVVGILPGLNKSPLFDPYAAIGMYSIMGQQTFLKGHNIVTEGKFDNKFYILFEGECEVQRTFVTQAYDPYNKLQEIKDNLIVPFSSKENHKLNIIRVGAIFGEEVLFGERVKYTNTVKVSSLFAKVLVFERERMLNRLTSETIEEFKKFYHTKQDNYFQSIRNAVQLKGYDIDPKSFYEDVAVTTKLREEKIMQSNRHSPSKVPFLIAHGVFKGEDDGGSMINQSQLENLNNSGGMTPGPYDSVRDSGMNGGNSLLMPNLVLSGQNEYNSAPKSSSIKILTSRVVSASVTRPMSSAAISISEKRPGTRPGTGAVVSFDLRTPTPTPIPDFSNQNTSSTNPFRNTVGGFHPKVEDNYNSAPAKSERASSAGNNFFTSIRALKMSSNAIFQSKEENTPFGNQFRVMLDNEKERKSAIRGERAPSAKKKTGQPKIRSSENEKVNFYDQNNIEYRLKLLNERTKKFQDVKSPLDIKFRFGDSKNKYEEKREAIVYGQFEKPAKETPNLHTLDKIMQKHIVNTYRQMGDADSGLIEVKDDIFTKYPRTERNTPQPYFSTIAVGKSRKSKKFVASEVINIHTINMREQKFKKRDMSRRSMRNADTQTGTTPVPDIELGTKTVVFARRDSQPNTRMSRVTVSGGSGAATFGDTHPTLTHFRANSDFTNTMKTRVENDV